MIRIIIFYISYMKSNESAWLVMGFLYFKTASALDSQFVKKFAVNKVHYRYAYNFCFIV